ncbi:hypothetical protein MHU86_19542 [Fragilaria crotonensis]|nr:hypothetical protein MHU86_19542 [Fragilaria crotonensis]
MSNNSNNDAPVDDFFLNFGSSSNVCDQLRHSIRQEVVEIDASIAVMEDESRKQDRVSQEMTRGLAHARKEMYNLGRVALDVVDSTHMNEILRGRVAEVLQKELVKPFFFKEMDKAAEDEADRGDSTSSPTGVMLLEDCQEEIKALLVTTAKAKVDTLANFDQKRALQNSITSTQRLRDAENLQEKSEIAEQEVKELSLELENEQRRLRIAKEAVHDARTKSGMHAQDIANNTKTLTAKKATHEGERKELATLLAQEEAELLQLKETDDMERKVREAVQTVDVLTKQIAEAEAARQRRSQIQECLKAVEEEVATLQEDARRMEQELIRSREATAVARRKHQEAKSYEVQVAAQKAHNQRVEIEKMIPGQKKLEELKNTKERLVMGINEAHSKLETDLVELKEEAKKKRDAASELELEMKSVARENDQTLEALTHIERAQQELRDSTERECTEYEDIARKFTEACDAERARHQELVATKEMNRKRILQNARMESAQRRQIMEEQLEMYKRAVEMMADVEAQQLELARLRESRNFEQ